MSSHLLNHTLQSFLLSPTFSVSISAPHDDLSSLKMTSCHTMIFYDKCSVSMVTGQYGPFYMVFLLGSMYPLILGPCQWATLLLSTIRLSLSLHWLVFIVFSHSLILIGSDRNDCFMSSSIHDSHFPTFSFSQELSVSFLFATYNNFHVFLMCFPHLNLPHLLWQDDLVPQTSNGFLPLPQCCSNGSFL